jgi:Mitochondrial small ribosomal subunit Rsm22
MHTCAIHTLLPTEAGVTGKAAKLCGAALTGRLQAVARLTARDRLQHHTSNSSRAAMTQAQKLEAEGMEAQAEEVWLSCSSNVACSTVPRKNTASSTVPCTCMRQCSVPRRTALRFTPPQLTERFGPQTLAWRRAVKAQAATMAELPLPMTRSGRVRASVRVQASLPLQLCGQGSICTRDPKALVFALHISSTLTWPRDAPQARAALEAHLMHGGALSLPHEYVRAALKLPPSTSLGDSERTAALQAAAPTYNARTAAAYGLVRLPACFAVASRVLHELSTRLPGFSPRSLLDFGAGPGTASWAAQEVRCSVAWHGMAKQAASPLVPQYPLVNAHLWPCLLLA